MKLTEFADSESPPLQLPALAGDKELVQHLQSRLHATGLLDPPAYGKFGPVTRWALSEFCKAAEIKFEETLSRPMARALLAPAAESLFPLKPGTDLAGKIVAAMQRRGHWVARHLDCVNIVYVEAMNDDGAPSDNKPNHFNDQRILIRVSRAGVPKILKQWEGTTEPGRFWTMNPMDSKGAARIAFNQYKSWAVGTHHPGKKGAHEALVQVDDITVCRDLNKDFKRDGDRQFTGVFAINQHWGYDLPKSDIGKAGAGCLIGRPRDGHREFMKAVKADPRFLANRAYRFMTTVMPVSALSEG
jgi:hypothetical protein